jgi:hypothetical protein
MPPPLEIQLGIRKLVISQYPPYVHYSGFIRIVYPESAASQDLKHLVIATRNIRHESSDSPLPHDSRQMDEQERAIP